MEKVVTYKDDQGDVVKEKKHYYPNRFDDEKGFLFQMGGGVYKKFLQIPFPDEMTDAEIGKLMRLANFMWKDTNMLGYRGHGGVKPYSIKDMARLLGAKENENGMELIKPLGERQIERFIKKMMDLGVMARSTVVTGGLTEIQYYINPLYAFSGTRINYNLYLLFHKSLDKYIPEWARKRFIGNSPQVFKEVFGSYGDKKRKAQKRLQS